MQAKKDEDLVRGELWVRERLLRAERQKEITPEQHSLAKWLLDQNPNIANDLAISFRAGEGAAAGQYNPVEKLLTLFKNRGDDMTAAHEILHHSERMMPEALRSKIHGAWIDSLQSLHDMAQDIGDQKLLGNIDLAIRAAAGDQDAYSKLSTAIGSGELPKSFYQYINPSEYWAVNASRLVQERAGADSWVKQAVQWMKDFLEHVKKTFGLDNQSAIIKGLNAVLEAKGEMTGRMIASMQDYFDIGPKDDASRVAEMLRKSAENENKVGVTVGARPGEFGWSFTKRDKTPPPIQHPVQRSPRLEKIGAAVQEIFAGRQFKTLVKDLTGASDIKVNQIEGTWLGNQEPSFVIQGKNLTDEAATKLAKTLGFLFAQDSTIKTTHSPDFAEGIPTLYIGSPDVLQKEQLDVIIEQARKHGLDLSTTTDKKAVRFMHFGDESELVTFTKSVISIAEAAGLESPITVRTQGELYEASEYLIGQVREDGTRVGLLGSEQDRSAVLGRLFDTVLVPYAKAIAGEGYRFSADRFAERFGLTEAERETLRAKLMPKEGLSRSTVPLMEGTEKLDIVPTVERTKDIKVLNEEKLLPALKKYGQQIISSTDAAKRFNDGEYIFAFHELDEAPTQITSIQQLESYAPDQLIALAADRAEKLKTKKVKTKYYVPNVTDIMWALQNRAASKGMIEPGDYSPKAMKIISETIADEVVYHMQHSAKSAIGWYDTALKKAKDMYKEIFPEITTNKDNGMLFDAILGITSQGNDVHSNSIFAARVYQLVKDNQMTLTEAVKSLKGSFGNQTVAIQNNLLKLEHLINVNGYDRMRQLFNETKTVGEWNAILRKDKTLYGPNKKPLKVDGSAKQKVTGWMVFGPKIGSFINNLHGDYSTLTADLRFTRTWNRVLGYMFQHSPLKEAKQYQEFKDALLAEYYQSTDTKTENGKPVMEKGKPVPWENGKDVIGMSKNDFDKLLNDPDMLLQLANQLETAYRKGGYKQKSDLRRRAKNWIEGREDPEAAPRTDLERTFQQETTEAAQKLIQKKTGNLVEIADIQAALWFHEKELFQKLGVSDKKSAPADYADAAKNALDMYRSGQLYYVAAEGKYVGGDNGQYLGISVPDEAGNTVEATKAIEQADTEVAKAKQDSQGFDAAVACALRG